METAQILETGNVVRVRRDHQDEWCLAVVVLASANGKSVALRLDGGAVRAGSGFMVGILPLSIDYEAGTVKSLMDEDYELEIRGEARR